MPDFEGQKAGDAPVTADSQREYHKKDSGRGYLLCGKQQP